MENINLKLKIYLEDSRDKFMGIGVLWLLRKMEQNMSLRAAANDLGISYSKAFRMVENLESALDMKVLDRKKGGSSRGGASLTDFGREFIALYDDFQRECKEIIRPRYEKFCSDLQETISRHS
jgi:molybdate transport repressor ModE-like protein